MKTKCPSETFATDCSAVCGAYTEGNASATTGDSLACRLNALLSDGNCAAAKKSPSEVCVDEKTLSNTTDKNIRVTLTFSMEYSTIKNDLERFKSTLRSDLSTALNVPASRVIIVEVLEGSVVVIFDIIGATYEGEKSSAELLENLKTQLEDDNSVFMKSTYGTTAKSISSCEPDSNSSGCVVESKKSKVWLYVVIPVAVVFGIATIVAVFFYLRKTGKIGPE